MSLRAGYYGVKKFLRDKLETIAGTYDETIKSLFPRSEQAVLGAKNLWNIQDPTIMYDASAGLTYSVLEKGYQLLNSIASEWASLKIVTASHLKANSDYKLSTNITITSGAARIIVSGATSQGGTYTNIVDTGNITANGKVEVTFNTEIYTWFRVTIYATVGTSAIGNVTYDDFMIRLASDPDNTYVTYAMTNRELTDSASDQKTAINAIISAATGAADFAAFKTAIGAITPVTRSLSLTKEDITEEVKEDVEPKKTVTKKRTTKKTEEV